MKYPLISAFCGTLLTSSTRASTAASIGLEKNESNIEWIDGECTTSTVGYEANTNYEPCACDMTAQSCDAFCCCD